MKRVFDEKNFAWSVDENEQRTICMNYKNSYYEDILEAYESISKGKRDSWLAIKREMKEKNGFDIKILSKNGWKYTCAYKFIDDNGITKLMYYTKDYRYIMDYIY